MRAASVASPALPSPAGRNPRVGGYLDEPTAGRLVQELRKAGFEAGLTP